MCSIKPMTNNDIKSLMNDTYSGIFKKWRDCTPARDSEKWDEVVSDVNNLLEKYKEWEPAKQLILWFLERIEERVMCEEEKHER